MGSQTGVTIGTARGLVYVLALDRGIRRLIRVSTAITLRVIEEAGPLVVNTSIGTFLDFENAEKLLDAFFVILVVDRHCRRPHQEMVFDHLAPEDDVVQAKTSSFAVDAKVHSRKCFAELLLTQRR